jgi:hypothetical protein
MTPTSDPSPPGETEAYRRGENGARAAVTMVASDGHEAQIATLVAMVARLSEHCHEYRCQIDDLRAALRDELRKHAEREKVKLPGPRKFSECAICGAVGPDIIQHSERCVLHLISRLSP